MGVLWRFHYTGTVFAHKLGKPETQGLLLLFDSPTTARKTARSSAHLADLFLPSLIRGFPGGSAGKGSTCGVGDLGSIPGLGRSPREGNGYPLQYFGLENSVDGIVRGVTKSRTQPRDFCLFARAALTRDH